MNTVLPYVLVAVLLLSFATLRAWRIFNSEVDWTLVVAFSVAAAAVAGSIDLGTDVLTYRPYYSTLLISDSQYSWWEPGFELVATLFARSGAPYGFFVFTCVLSSHLLKLHVLDKLSSNRLLGFFVLFCTNVGELAFVRQYIAASLIFFSFYLLTKERVTLAVLFVLLATLFHKSALIPGMVVITTYFGLSSAKPLVVLSIIAVAIVSVLPTNIVSALQERILQQGASYASEEFVQGLGDQTTSLFRNLAKFLGYGALSLWMLLLPPREGATQGQRKSAHIVVALSLVSICLITASSTVFARLSVYIFPFLALSIRTERFSPYRSQFMGQYIVTGLLVINLVIAIYPAADYF